MKELIEYIADSPLLAHNAKFDIWHESGGLKGMGAPAGWVTSRVAADLPLFLVVYWLTSWLTSLI